MQRGAEGGETADPLAEPFQILLGFLEEHLFGPSHSIILNHFHWVELGIGAQEQSPIIRFTRIQGITNG